MKKTSGFFAIVALVLLIFAGVISAVLVHAIVNANESHLAGESGVQSFYLAQSGLQRGMARLVGQYNSNLSERISCANISSNSLFNNVSLGAGSFTVTASLQNPSTVATLTDNPLSASATTINVNTTTGYASSGRLRLGREDVSYSGTSSQAFLNVQRGINGTDASTHAQGTAVGQYQCQLISTGYVPDNTNYRGRTQLQQSVQLAPAFLVGNRNAGRPLIAVWNGGNWSRMTTNGFGNIHLFALSMPSYVFGWAAGNSRLLLRWNGSNWTRYSANSLPNQNYRAVYCLNQQDCWLVGTQSQNREQFIHWNGTNWQVAQTINLRRNLFGVYCTASNNCWAVGQDQGNYVNINLYQQGTWSRLPSSIVPSVNRDLYSVACADVNTCFAVGQRQGGYALILRMVDNPSANPPARQEKIWQRVPSSNIANNSNQNLQAVTCINSQDCWAVGNSRTILHWTGGNNWTLVSPGNLPNVRLNNISCPAVKDCWLVGNNGVIGHWNGQQWQRVSENLPNSHFRAIQGFYSGQPAFFGWQENFDQ